MHRLIVRPLQEAEREARKKAKAAEKAAKEAAKAARASRSQLVDSPCSAFGRIQSALRQRMSAHLLGP